MTTDTTDTNARLARIEGRLEGMCEHIDGRFDEARDDMAYLRGRVDVLDRQSAVTGGISGAVAGVGLAVIGEMLRRHLL
jgi:DNA-binding FrmR family transcriptional regulator